MPNQKTPITNEDLLLDNSAIKIAIKQRLTREDIILTGSFQPLRFNRFARLDNPAVYKMMQDQKIEIRQVVVNNYFRYPHYIYNDEMVDKYGRYITHKELEFLALVVGVHIKVTMEFIDFKNK